MKVALLLCPSWDSTNPLVSLALLAALLKKRGHETQIIDLNHRMALLELARGALLGKTADLEGGYGFGSERIGIGSLPAYRDWLESVIAKLLSDGTRVVGFSMYDSNIEMSFAVAKMLKRLAPEVKIVFGGPSCLSFAACLEFLKHDCLDAVIYGEADLSFPRLVDALDKSGRLEAAPGVLLREDPSTWKEEQDAIENMDELPYADYDAYGSLDTYRSLVLCTSRGCIRKCVYCSEWQERPYRRMSGRRIFDELVHQLERHPRHTSFLFGDSLLNSSMKELSIFCDLVIANKLPISWRGWAIVRPEMTPAFLAKMRAAGCDTLYYGIESGSWPVLQRMRKLVPPALNARVLRDTRDAGILPYALWMAGFPSETEETFRESLDFVAANAQGIGALILTLFSIGPMRAEHDEYDLDPNADNLYWRTRDGKNTFPVRLDRLRRLMETANKGGISTCFLVTMQGAIHLPQLPEYEREALCLYEPHAIAAGSPRSIGQRKA